MRRPPILPAIFLVLTMLAVACPAPAQAVSFETQTEQEGILKKIAVDEHPGAAIPKGLSFTDQDGRHVMFGDYLGKTPVILTLNYYECPMLCPITFRNLIGTIKEMKGLTPGKDFRVVTVSFNPDEDLARTSARAKDTYAMLAGSPDPGKWWAFLFGRPESIDPLTAAAGFKYVKLGPDNFAHPSVLIVLTPDGRVSRYLYGLDIAPGDLRLALVEAAGGEIGASRTLNRILLFCYHYDPVGRKYQLAAIKLMKAGGAFTLIALATVLLILWMRESRKRTGGKNA